MARVSDLMSRYARSRLMADGKLRSQNSLLIKMAPIRYPVFLLPGSMSVIEGLEYGEVRFLLFFLVFLSNFSLAF